MRHLPFVAVVLALRLHGLQLGQSAREEALGRASRETQVRVNFDRSEYFPGEEVVATARVANESSTTIEVPDPEDALHLRLDVDRYRRDRPDKPEPASRPAALTLADPRCFNKWNPFATPRCIDTTVPGPYVLKAALALGGRGHGPAPQMQFSVVTPNLYLWERAMLSRVFTVPPEMLRGVPPERIRPLPLFVPVAAVEHNGEHSVLVRRSAGHFWILLTPGPLRSVLSSRDASPTNLVLERIR